MVFNAVCYHAWMRVQDEFKSDNVAYAMGEIGPSQIKLQDPLAKNFREAKASKDWPLYKKAMEKEVLNLENFEATAPGLAARIGWLFARNCGLALP